MRVSRLLNCARCFATWDLRSASAETIISLHKDGVEEILNLQPKGAKAKPYQVKQVRNVILKYKLGGSDDAI